MAPWTGYNSALASSSKVALPQAVPLWAEQDQPRYTAIVDSDGDFNGTCTMTGESIPLLLDDNMCASWFPDVTTFCCGAVGGILQQADEENISTGNDSTSAVYEPVCVTSNYHDMLDCYMFTSIGSCSSTDVAPWGVCNAQNVDTSRTLSQSNGDLSIRSTPHRMTLLLLFLLLPLLTATVS